MKKKQLTQTKYSRVQRQREYNKEKEQAEVERGEHYGNGGRRTVRATEEYVLSSMMLESGGRWRDDAKEADAIVFMYNIDDRNFSGKARARLFHALQAMLAPGECASRQMQCNLTSLLAYYNTPRDKRKHTGSFAKRESRATHVIVCWSRILDHVKRAVLDTPYNVFMQPGYDVGLDAFLLHERVANYVHILNWNVRHASSNDSGDPQYTQEFVDCVKFIKRFYLTPDSSVDYLVADIYPIAVTLQFFTLGMGFQINRADVARNVRSDDECERLYCAFKEAVERRDTHSMRTLLSEPAYRTVLPNGDSVLRLYYYPALCACTQLAMTARDILATHCPECGEIYYCTKGCDAWQRCCSSS